MSELNNTINDPMNVIDPVEKKEIEMTPEQEQKAVEDLKKRYKKNHISEEQKANKRFWDFLDLVYKLARMSGLYIEGRIKVRDIKTGKVWE